MSKMSKMSKIKTTCFCFIVGYLLLTTGCNPNEETIKRCNSPSTVVVKNGFIWIYDPANDDGFCNGEPDCQIDDPITVSPLGIVSVKEWDGSGRTNCGQEFHGLEGCCITLGSQQRGGSARGGYHVYNDAIYVKGTSKEQMIQIINEAKVSW